MVQDHFTCKKFYKMVQGIAIEKTGLVSRRSLIHKCTPQKSTTADLICWQMNAGGLFLAFLTHTYLTDILYSPWVLCALLSTLLSHWHKLMLSLAYYFFMADMRFKRGRGSMYLLLSLLFYMHEYMNSSFVSFFFLEKNILRSNIRTLP